MVEYFKADGVLPLALKMRRSLSPCAIDSQKIYKIRARKSAPHFLFLFSFYFISFSLISVVFLFSPFGFRACFGGYGRCSISSIAEFNGFMSKCLHGCAIEPLFALVRSIFISFARCLSK